MSRFVGIVGQGENERNEITPVDSEVLRNTVYLRKYEKRSVGRDDWEEIKDDFKKYKSRMQREEAII